MQIIFVISKLNNNIIFPLHILKCKHMTLAISKLNNIFALYTKAQDYHLTYPNMLL